MTDNIKESLKFKLFRYLVSIAVFYIATYISSSFYSDEKKISEILSSFMNDGTAKWVGYLLVIYLLFSTLVIVINLIYNKYRKKRYSVDHFKSKFLSEILDEISGGVFGFGASVTGVMLSAIHFEVHNSLLGISLYVALVIILSFALLMFIFGSLVLLFSSNANPLEANNIY